MSRYKLMRQAVDGLEQASNKAFRCVHASLDWIEKRDPKARPSASAPREPSSSDEAIDEAAAESFPASDPPAGWAGPPDS